MKNLQKILSAGILVAVITFGTTFAKAQTQSADGVIITNVAGVIITNIAGVIITNVTGVIITN